jgi:site-specific DNA-methyltransferase (adenine-specific)
VGVLRRIVAASSKPGDVVLDFFAGSGTIGEVCLELGRCFILVDNNPQAINVMKKRFMEEDSIKWIDEGSQSAS